MTGTRFPAPGHSVIGDRRWWRISGQSRLDAMLNCVPNKECAGDGVPWQPGNSMQIRSRGGARSLERERMAIVGHAGYVNIVTGHRETTTDTQALVCEQSRVIDVGRMDSSASDDGAGVEWGRDRLHVKGDAVLEYGSRGANVTGTVERIWNQHSSCTAGLSCVTRAAGEWSPTRSTVLPSTFPPSIRWKYAAVPLEPQGVGYTWQLSAIRW